MYHAPKRFIPKLQLMLRPGKAWLFYKLKYDDLYNRLVQGPKMAVSIGPVESVTYQSSLQVLLHKVWIEDFLSFNGFNLFNHVQTCSVSLHVHCLRAHGVSEE